MSPTLVGIAIISILSFALIVLRRIVFHRLAHIPGPFLARFTYLYELYYDVMLGGQYIWAIRDMHEKYGPIVRINPEQIHIQDAEYYNEVFTGPGRKRDKEKSFNPNLNQSIITTTDHDLHRLRRRALAPYFTRAKIRELQPRIDVCIKNLLRRLDSCRELKAPLSASIAYTVFTNDVISEYAFANGKHQINTPHAAVAFTDADRTGTRLRHLVRNVQWVAKIVKLLPREVLTRLNPEQGAQKQLQKDIHEQVKDICDQRGRVGKDSRFQTNVFHGVLESDIPEHEKTPSRLCDEGLLLIVGGTLSTATVLSEITFHLLHDHDALYRLKEEIMTVMPDPDVLPSLASVEKLPFFKAIIYEGLRLNNGTSLRLSRIATEETLSYTTRVASKDGKMKEKQYSIPPLTPVLMTPLLIHQSPKYFEDPLVFRPQRWIDNPTLDKYFVPFSRGSRQCIAKDLALAELYLTFTAVFRKYGSRQIRFRDDVGYLELDGTTPEDMEIIGDALTPLFRTTKRLLIRVRDHEGKFEDE